MAIIVEWLFEANSTARAECGPVSWSVVYLQPAVLSSVLRRFTVKAAIARVVHATAMEFAETAAALQGG